MIVRAALFPGSKYIMRKNLENNYALRLGKMIVLNLRGLRNTLDQLKENENSDISFLRPRVEETRVMISSVRELFQIIEEEQDLTDKQLHFYRKLTRAEKLLQQTLIEYHQETKSLWKLCEPPEGSSSRVSHYARNVVLLHKTPENLSKMTQLIDLASEIAEDIIFNIKRPAKCCDFLKWFTSEKYVGTLQTMRAELKLRYQGQQMWVKTEDGHKIDSMFLPCQQSMRPQSGSGEMESERDYPVMIICNPNAGFYEFIYYQNEWLDYYLTMGVHVFVWNYRGFGRNKGTPDPYNICKDAEAVYYHIKQEMKIARVGVHGESLGGNVACHLARKVDVDFLFADRTFSSLDKVVQTKSNKCIMYLLKFVTFCWSMEAAQNYVFARCYKVVANAYNDEIISDVSSLKNGISEKVVELELQNFKQKKIKLKETNKEKKKRIQSSLIPERYIHFLQPNQLTFLHTNLSKIQEVIRDFNAIGKLFANDNLEASPGSTALPFGPRIRAHMVRNVLEQRPQSSTEGLPELAGHFQGPKRKGFQSLMAEQAGFPEGESSEDFSIDEDEEDKEPTAEVIATHDDFTAKGSLSPQRKKHPSSSSSPSDKKAVLKERLEWLRDHDKHEMEEARKALRKYESKMSLAELKLMVRLTKRVEKELKALDSAGIKLLQILLMARRKQRTQLKLFLINLQVWGCFHPLRMQSFDMANTRRAASKEVGLFLSNMGELLNSCKNQEGVVLQEFLANCEVAHHYFSRIKGYMGLKKAIHTHRDSEASTGSSKRRPLGSTEEDQEEEEVLSERDHHQDSQDISKEEEVGGDEDLEGESQNTREKFLSADDMDLPGGSQVFMKRAVHFNSDLEPDVSRTGYLIPLNMGHHGNMGPIAKNIFEMHLQHAGFLNENII